MLHLYTGNGKGKTCVCVGLACRALGAGLNVFFGQFFKGGMLSNEFNFLLTANKTQFTHEMFGSGEFILDKPSDLDLKLAHDGLLRAKWALNHYDIVILDEAIYALKYEIITQDALFDLIDATPPHVELILSGRDAPPELITRADLVTELLERKHYYHQNIPCRPGIDF